MALVVTSANGSIGLNDTKVRLTAFTNPATGPIGAPTFLVVDGEQMRVTDTTLSPVLGVTRGSGGTLASAHNTLAPVVYGLSTDFTQDVSLNGVAGTPSYSYGVNDTNVTLPVVDCTVYIDKATAIGLTINSPNKDQVNTIRFVSLTAAAHLITYTPGFYGNTTSSDVATFPATVGACFTIVAKNGLWNAVAAADDGVTIG